MVTTDIQGPEEAAMLQFLLRFYIHLSFSTRHRGLFLWLALVFSGTWIVPNGNAGIVYPQAPEGGQQVVSNLLDSRILKPMTYLPPAKDLRIARPFGVYGYGMNYTNVLSGRLLSATKLNSWRFMLTDGTNSAGLDLGYDKKLGEWPELGWSFHPARPNNSDPVLATLQAAARLPQVQKADYELRYLNFLEIQFFAVWLHGQSNDIIIPVPVYGRWQSYRPYSEREMIELLKPEIKNRMKTPAYKGGGLPVD